MFVRTKNKNRVYYDAEQGVHIDDKRIYEVKATDLVRELLRTGELIETDGPSKELLKKYADEDKAKAARVAKAKTNSGINKPIESQLKASKARVAELEEALVIANATIADLEDQLSKAGDPKSQEVKDLKSKKAFGTSVKKETTEAVVREKA